MSVVLTMVVRDAADVLEANLAFHLNAGVDFVIAGDPGSQDGTTEILDSFSRDGHLVRMPVEGGSERAWRTEIARLAVAEYGADWVISSSTDEFWWPRGESLEDVLAVIPPRYSVVQALVRVFPPRADGGDFFAERMTVRSSLLASGERVEEPLHSMLRPVYRAEPNMVIDQEDWTLGGRRVPLRAWYPIEVFRFPVRAGFPADNAVDDPRIASGLADGSLVVDERLRDALRRLRFGETGFAPPGEGVDRLELRAPTIVDDASYAVECAAVGEVDLVRLDRHIQELEQRIAVLEARFWPRVVRRLARLGRPRR